MGTVRDYLEKLRPMLEDAFNKELSSLVGGIQARDMVSLMATLKAGKKIRGCLSCMVNEALGGVLDAAIPRATAVELIQAATLIHDDFVDQDKLRRNRPAVWTLEGARRAVLIGDVIFSTAIKMMNDFTRADSETIIQAIVQVSKGALREPLDPLALSREIEAKRVSSGLYMEIIRLKTGILFGTACKLGAIAAEASSELRKKAYLYGIRIGEAYQIADDVKEVEQHLSTRSIQPKQMAALSPAFLYFANEIPSSLLPLLRGESMHLTDPVLEFFGATVKLMENEIERLLQSAHSEIGHYFPDNGYGVLMREAPWDMIKIFRES